jgi:uncharacterized protein
MVNCFDCTPAGDRYPARLWGDTELLRPDLFVDSLISPTGYDLMARLTGVDASDLAGWQKTVDAYFEANARRCCMVKVALAYGRPLRFAPDVSSEQAAKLYAGHRAGVLPASDIRPLEDYLFHHILARAADYSLPLKFHTGLYSGADYLNDYALRDNVRDLAQLAIAHPECRFVVMHIAYPFQDELVMAARQVSNLYAEMSWAWVVDPAAAARFMRQMLEAAPLNKLLGFGGDYSLVENTYGHLQIARQGMAAVLADLVSERGWSLDEACEAGYYALAGAAEHLL